MIIYKNQKKDADMLWYVMQSLEFRKKHEHASKCDGASRIELLALSLINKNLRYSSLINMDSMITYNVIKFGIPHATILYNAKYNTLQKMFWCELQNIKRRKEIKNKKLFILSRYNTKRK